VKGKNPTGYLFYPLSPWFTISKKAQAAKEEGNIKGIQYMNDLFCTFLVYTWQ
jgi:hypothetical protein